MSALEWWIEAPAACNVCWRGVPLAICAGMPEDDECTDLRLRICSRCLKLAVELAIGEEIPLPTDETPAQRSARLSLVKP